ncbi:MAG: S41 family peptidase [Terracidiphilus sp.]
MAQAIDSSAARRAHWDQDIDAFVQGFSARGSTPDVTGAISSHGQIDFEKLYPPKRFKAQIDALKQSIDTRSDAEIVLELARIVASAHVAHTAVGIPTSMGFERALPVQFRWFSDGMIVWLATPAYQQLVGLRVARVGSMAPEDLEKAVAPFVSYENESWLRWRAPTLMTLRPVLEALHLMDADGYVTLALDRPGEKQLEVKLPFSENPQPWIGVFAALRRPFPMNFRQRDRNYWYRYLDDSQTAYINYGDCAEDPKLPFAEFVRSMLADLDAKPVHRVVIDLTRNGGGDSRVIHPLLQALKTHPQWSGKIYVLIGPPTFSAAVMNAIKLKLELHATLVGEPTGGKPGSYGEVKALTLPNSKLVIQYSTRYFAADKGMDGPTLVPDIAAGMSRADLLAGRDPALNAAIQAGAQN